MPDDDRGYRTQHEPLNADELADLWEHCLDYGHVYEAPAEDELWLLEPWIDAARYAEIETLADLTEHERALLADAKVQWIQEDGDAGWAWGIAELPANRRPGGASEPYVVLHAQGHSVSGVTIRVDGYHPTLEKAREAVRG